MLAFMWFCGCVIYEMCVVSRWVRSMLSAFMWFCGCVIYEMCVVSRWVHFHHRFGMLGHIIKYGVCLFLQFWCKLDYTLWWPVQNVVVTNLRQDIPQWSFNPKRLIFVALCNDLINYFIVCFEHQCNTMRAC